MSVADVSEISVSNSSPSFQVHAVVLLVHVVPVHIIVHGLAEKREVIGKPGKSSPRERIQSNRNLALCPLCLTRTPTSEHLRVSMGVMHGGLIEKPKKIFGHDSVVMTDRYAHFRPDLWGVIAGRHIPRPMSRMDRFSTT